MLAETSGITVDASWLSLLEAMRPILSNVHLLFATVLYILAFICTVKGIPGMVTEAKLQNLYQCPDHKNLSLIIQNTYVKRTSATEVRLYGKLFFQELIQDAKLRIDMHKCASKSEPDTCEFYTSLNIGSLCEYFKQKKEPWYGYFSSTTMPTKCPIHKGVYDINGTKIGLTSSFPLINGFWMFRNRGYGPNKKLLMCFQMELIILSHFG